MTTTQRITLDDFRAEYLRLTGAFGKPMPSLERLRALHRAVEAATPGAVARAIEYIVADGKWPSGKSFVAAVTRASRPSDEEHNAAQRRLVNAWWEFDRWWHGFRKTVRSDETVDETLTAARAELDGLVASNAIPRSLLAFFDKQAKFRIGMVGYVWDSGRKPVPPRAAGEPTFAREPMRVGALLETVVPVRGGDPDVPPEPETAHA